MEDIAATLFTTIIGGGPHAIVAILLAVVGGLFVELRRLRALLAAKNARIDTIIDNYHTGAISMTEALNALKLVLWELKAKL